MNAVARIGIPARPRLRVPARSVAGLAGTNFKYDHLQAIMTEGKHGGFFEVHAENYMGAGGPPTARSSISAAIIRFHCTAFVCRSAVRGRSRPRISNAFGRWSCVTNLR
jgi:hypothetical protein